MSTTRRQFISRAAAAGVALGAPSLLAACGGGDPTTASACDGYSALTTQEVQVRQGLNYVDRSPKPAELCSNCMHYNAPAESACGGCKLFAGPVIAGGYCTAWAAQTT
ncbi:MAG: high-potential iron-sulfur protein [Sandaracinaceae bacterium]